MPLRNNSDPSIHSCKQLLPMCSVFNHSHTATHRVYEPSPFTRRKVVHINCSEPALSPWCFRRSLATAWTGATQIHVGSLQITAAHQSLFRPLWQLPFLKADENCIAKPIKVMSRAKADDRNRSQSLWSNRREGFKSKKHTDLLPVPLTAPGSSSNFESERHITAEDALEECPWIEMSMHERHFRSSQFMPCLVESHSKCSVSLTWSVFVNLLSALILEIATNIKTTSNPFAPTCLNEQLDSSWLPWAKWRSA